MLSLGVSLGSLYAAEPGPDGRTGEFEWRLLQAKPEELETGEFEARAREAARNQESKRMKAAAPEDDEETGEIEAHKRAECDLGIRLLADLPAEPTRPAAPSITPRICEHCKDHQGKRTALEVRCTEPLSLYRYHIACFTCINNPKLRLTYTCACGYNPSNTDYLAAQHWFTCKTCNVKLDLRSFSASEQEGLRSEFCPTCSAVQKIMHPPVLRQPKGPRALTGIVPTIYHALPSAAEIAARITGAVPKVALHLRMELEKRVAAMIEQPPAH
jgi:hypothetical protein